ncbi:MAG: FAD binding domain-containing protein [Caldisericaceae bacterium]
MKDIDYFKANTIEEAFSILSDRKESIRVIAGGTDILIRLKQDMLKEDEILDISPIKELKGIYEDGEYIHILPLTTHTQIVESDLIKKFLPVLQQACKSIGSPQIRNRGTIGGNIANASPAGDSLPALFVSEAKLKLASKASERTINVEDFFVGPGKTVKRNDELLVDIVIPKFKENEAGFFKKIGQRKGIAISVISVAAKLQVDAENHFSKALVSFGAVAPTVVRGKIVENALMSEPLDSLDKISYISKLAFREVSPISDIRGSFEYRRDMSTNLLYEGLVELFNNGWRNAR